MTDISRRQMVGCLGGAAIAALAGCSDVLGNPDGGPRFEEGDEESVMLSASFFGDSWSEEPEEEDTEENVTDDGYEWGFDPDEVPSSEGTFWSGDESEMVICSITILEDADKAEEEVKSFGEANLVGAEEPDIGDYAVRGEFHNTGLICYSLANALVISTAGTIQGFSISANHNNSLEAAEEIEARLEDL